MIKAKNIDSHPLSWGRGGRRHLGSCCSGVCEGVLPGCRGIMRLLWEFQRKLKTGTAPAQGGRTGRLPLLPIFVPGPLLAEPNRKPAGKKGHLQSAVTMHSGRLGLELRKPTDKKEVVGDEEAQR